MAVTVLVVEDEEPVANIISMLVEDLGHRVFTAPDGIEGLKIAKQEKPALVICDIMMPRMPGDELCRRLKRSAEYHDVKVVLMSAAGPTRAAGTGADAFLRKPFDLETIEQLVARFT